TFHAEHCCSTNRAPQLPHVERRHRHGPIHHLSPLPSAPIIHRHPPPLFRPVVPILIQLEEHLEPIRLHHIRNAVVVRVPLIEIHIRVLPHLRVNQIGRA